MMHLEDRMIVTIRDGALITADARLHAEQCPTCAEALLSAVRRANTISEALASLDTPFDVEAAKTRVRGRLGVTRESDPRGAARAAPWYLGRAAALLLLTAGAAYAVPGSSLAGWLGFESSSAPEQSDVAPASSGLLPSTGGIEVAVRDGSLRVTLEAVTLGSELEVTWLDEQIARITAAAGSEYAFADGHIEATVEAGPVRLELPRVASAISLEVNGRVLLRKSSGGGLELTGTVVEQDSDRIVFQIRER